MILNSNPTASVIIPNRNYARYLTESVNSCLQQSFKAIEVLIIDDASDDDSCSLISKISDHRVRLLKNVKPQGASRARNRGVLEAKGEYIFFLDSDDRMSKLNIQIKLAAFSESPTTNLIHSNYFLMDENGSILGCADGETSAINSYDSNASWNLLLRGNCIATSTVAVRRTVFLETGGFDPNIRHAEDWDLWLRISRLGGIKYSPQPLIFHRIHASSTSRMNILSGHDLRDLAYIINKLQDASLISVEERNLLMNIHFWRFTRRIVSQAESNWAWLKPALDRLRFHPREAIQIGTLRCLLDGFLRTTCGKNFFTSLQRYRWRRRMRSIERWTP